MRNKETCSRIIILTINNLVLRLMHTLFFALTYIHYQVKLFSSTCKTSRDLRWDPRTKIPPSSKISFTLFRTCDVYSLRADFSPLPLLSVSFTFFYAPPAPKNGIGWYFMICKGWKTRSWLSVAKCNRPITTIPESCDFHFQYPLLLVIWHLRCKRHDR